MKILAALLLISGMICMFCGLSAVDGKASFAKRFHALVFLVTGQAGIVFGLVIFAMLLVQAMER